MKQTIASVVSSIAARAINKQYSSVNSQFVGWRTCSEAHVFTIAFFAPENDREVCMYLHD